MNLVCGLSGEFHSHVLCLSRRGEFADRLQPAQVSALGKAEGFSWRTVAQVAAFLFRQRPDVIHTHNLGPLLYATLATAGGRLGAIVHGEHSLLTEAETAAGKLNQRRRFYRACRAVHTVAPIVRDQLLALDCAPRRLEVIPNGVDVGRFSPGDRAAARGAIGIAHDGPLLGIVARFGRYKGHLELIEAFQHTAAQHPAARLLVVGSGGPLETAVRDAAAHSAVLERIHFTGFVSDPVPVYRALDLLVVPSTNEGMANAALEAMACGVPVLGNTGCGHEAMIDSGSDGVLADLRHPAALAAQMSALLADRARLAVLGASARSKVGESFSIGAMLRAYAALYRSIRP